MCGSGYGFDIDILARLDRMADAEVERELKRLRILALWRYRNDDGIEDNKEYRDFHACFRSVKREALKRGILRDTECYIS